MSVVGRVMVVRASFVLRDVAETDTVVTMAVVVVSAVLVVSLTGIPLLAMGDMIVLSLVVTSGVAMIQFQIELDGIIIIRLIFSCPLTFFWNKHDTYPLSLIIYIWDITAKGSSWHHSIVSSM